MNGRLTWLIGILGVVYIILVFRLSELQLRDGKEYLIRAESQFAAAHALKAERGTMYFTDRNGNLLPAATNKNFPSIYAVPKVIEDASEAAHRVASVLGESPESLVARFEKKDEDYRLLKRKAPEAVSREIEALRIPGIYVELVPERFYTFGAFASHVLGFVGPKSEGTGDTGQYGLERFYEERLAGRHGASDGEKITLPQPGENVALTIDPNLQIEAEKILEKLVKTHSAKSGTVIVEDPTSGKILAMGSYPSFDPNSYSDSDIGAFLNPAVQQVYEPGSVFKVITMASGIDAGKITPETTFYDKGTLVVSGRKIQNWDLKAHGTVTMTNVIEKSINTGAAFAQRQTGRELFTKYVERFGFSEKTGIDLPGEVRGDLRRLEPQAPEVAFATASFGQGVSVTPIGLINAFAAIANGGKLMRPYLNSALEPAVVREVISPEAARAVTDMMISAVDKAEVASIKSYTLAGKTGTAQIPDFVRGGYTDRVVNTYAGFGPTHDPRFVILFKLDDPAGGPVAGLTVVPAFRELAQFIVNYYNIPPDRL